MIDTMIKQAWEARLLIAIALVAYFLGFSIALLSSSNFKALADKANDFCLAPNQPATIYQGIYGARWENGTLTRLRLGAVAPGFMGVLSIGDNISPNLTPR